MKGKTKILLISLISILLFLCGSVSVIAAPTEDVTRIADNNTMDSYKDILIDMSEDGYGSLYAGRVWTDKTVLQYGKDRNSILLDEKTDGIDTQVEFNEDFLHVYSALGSSQENAEETPIDLVMVLDVSGSMGSSEDEDSKISASIQAMNNAIHTVLSLNPNNRVGVVLFASWAKTLLELDHYNVKDDKNYISVQDWGKYSEDTIITEDSVVFYKYQINVNGLTSSTKQGPIKSEIITTNGNRNYIDSPENPDPRVIGGNTNMDSGFWTGLNMLATNPSTTVEINGRTVSYQPAFIFLGDGDPQNRMRVNSNNWWDPISKLDSFEGGYFNDAGTIASTIMRAAYMKALVEKNYNKLSDDDSAQVKLLFETVGIELGQTGHEYGENVAKAILNPKEGFNTTSGDTAITNAFKNWSNWQNTNSAVYIYKNNAIDVTLNQFPSGMAGVSKEDVIANINYTNKFYNAENVSQIPEALEALVKDISNATFMPIHGENSAGIRNALTYMDPIGDYMEVKEVSDLVLLGSHYKVRKTGMYNPAFNNDYSEINSEAVKTGWYRIKNDDGTLTRNDANEAVYTNKQGLDDHKWDEEGVSYYYLLSFEDACEAIPNLEVESADINYTVYSIDSLVDGDDPRTNEKITNVKLDISSGNAETDKLTKDTLLWNPVYGNKPDKLSENDKGVYTLGSIKMWVKDIGHHIDSQDNGNGEPLSPSRDYEQAFYINLPNNALPLQTVSISSNSNGIESRYETNLDKPKQSTPFRVFYEVGLKNELLNNDGYIDLTKLADIEYIKNHTVRSDEGNTVYFLSNFYSNSYYEKYTSDTRDSRTQGNAVTTFAPNPENKDYFFTENKLLYYAADGESPKPERLKESDERFENFINSDHLISNSSQEILNSSDWYYVVYNYYAFGDNSTAYKTSVAVARRGSELGIGTESQSSFLHWFNPVDLSTAEIDSSFDFKENYYIAIKQGASRVGDLGLLIGTKGLQIGEDSTTSEKEVQNKTETAYNYYIPTIRNNSEASTEINAYLGNNGRLEVKNSQLLLTKKVKNTVVESDAVNPDKDFKFEVEFKDENDNSFSYSGEKNAIQVIYDPTINEWVRKVDSIDVITQNNGLLQMANSDLALFGIVEGEYKPLVQKDDKYYLYDSTIMDNLGMEYEVGDDETGLFYIYIGVSEGKENNYTVYQASEDNIPEINNGVIDIYVDKVYPIPKASYEAQSPDEIQNLTLYTQEEIEPIDHFLIASIRIRDNKDLRSGTDITSDYLTQSNYSTTTVNFIDNKAEVTLKDRQGLIFDGLDTGVKYTVTEKLSKDDLESGYTFGSVTHVEEDSYTVYVEDEKQAKILEYAIFDSSSSGITNITPITEFDPTVEAAIFDKHNYSISGKTGNYEQAVHFVNEPPFVNKTEVNPGEGEFVKIGDSIDYEIIWSNFSEEAGTVKISDSLDIGVDFVQATLDPDALYKNSEGQIVYRSSDGSEVLEDPDPDNSLVLLSDQENSVNVSTDNNQYSIEYIGSPESSDKDGHQVIWTLNHIPSGDYGFVTLTVNVNAKANQYWNYNQEDSTTEFNKDYLVRNKAIITANDISIDTDIIINPTEDREKREVTPGEGKQVQPGDYVVYEIDWVNYESDFADITVTDLLDEGVNFIAAYDQKFSEEEIKSVLDSKDWGLVGLPDSPQKNNANVLVATYNPELTDNEARYPETPAITSESKIESLDETTISYTYSAEELKQTVSWVLRNRPNVEYIDKTIPDQDFGAKYGMGTVTLIVQVNNKADNYWNYVNDGTFTDQLNSINDSEITDKFIRNQASVQVGNSTVIKTKVIENPTHPDKNEVSPGNGIAVKVGDQIHYSITWQNTSDAIGDLRVIDPLDEGVDFTEAWYDPNRNLSKVDEFLDTTDSDIVAINAEIKSVSKGDVTIEYDSIRHRVNWTFANVDPGASGIVDLVVTVNEKANKSWDYTDADIPTFDQNSNTDNYGGTGNTETTDNLVTNRAVIVPPNNASPEFTEKVTNPLGSPHLILNLSHKLGEDEEFNKNLQELSLNSEVIYRIEVSNTGDNEANNVIVSDQIPDYLTITDNIIGKNLNSLEPINIDNSKTSMSTGYIQTEPFALSPNESAEFIIPTKVTLTDQKETWWMNHASLTYDQIGNEIHLPENCPNLQNDLVTAMSLSPEDISKNYCSYDHFTNETDCGINIKNQDQENLYHSNKPTQNEGSNKFSNDVAEHIVFADNNWKPVKTEQSPGASKEVTVGDVVTYTITWKNYQDKVATVIVADKLDPGVTFESAGYESGNQGSEPVYDSVNRTVMWNLGEQEPQAQGIVKLVVTVNSNAKYNWSYSNGENYFNSSTTVDSSIEDSHILNQAGVKIGNDSWLYTEIIENPLWRPKKSETDPGEGELVVPDQIVTYQIEWKNYKNQTATIQIGDTLDSNVAYIEGTEAAYIATGLNAYNKINSTFTSGNSILNWNLGSQPAGSSGYVEFKVRVLEGALTVGKIRNQGSVKVDNDSYLTNIIDNPTYSNNNISVEKYHRTGNRTDWYTELNVVENGQTIEYKLVVTNTGNVTIHNVILTDPIPETLVVDEASFNGTIIGNSKSETVFSPKIITTGQKTKLEWTLGSMVPNEKIEIVFKVQMPKEKSKTVYWVNHAYVTYDEIASRGNTIASSLNSQSLDLNEEQVVDLENDTLLEQDVLTNGEPDEPSEHSETENLAALQSSSTHISAHLTASTTANTIHSDLAPSNSMVIYTEDVPETVENTPNLEITKAQSVNRNNNVGYSETNDGQITTNTLNVLEADVITYYLKVTNNGEGPATNVVLTDTIPSGLIYVPNSATYTAVLTQNENTLTWSIGSLGAGESVQVQFQAIVPAIISQQSWRNTAYINSDNSPQIPSNTVVSVGTPNSPSSSISTNTNTNTPTSSVVPTTTKTVGVTNSNVTQTGVSPKTGITGGISVFALTGVAAVITLLDQTRRKNKRDEDNEE